MGWTITKQLKTTVTATSAQASAHLVQIIIPLGEYSRVKIMFVEGGSLATNYFDIGFSQSAAETRQIRLHKDVGSRIAKQWDNGLDVGVRQFVLDCRGYFDVGDTVWFKVGFKFWRGNE